VGVAGKMRAKAEIAETAGKTWEREFAVGTTNWQYWMRIIMPFIQAVVTVVLPEKVVEELDLLVGDGIFLSRSEAIRTAIYNLLRKEGRESNVDSSSRQPNRT